MAAKAGISQLAQRMTRFRSEPPNDSGTTRRGIHSHGCTEVGVADDDMLIGTG